MSETNAAPDSHGFELSALRAEADDPLFSGARYTFRAVSDGVMFEIVVALSPYFVNLLTMNERRNLEGVAYGVAERLLDEGVRGPATARVSADGRVLHGGRTVASLLPHDKPAPAPAKAAHA